MPLDGHAYLVSQGWGGKGSGLRQDAIAKPITVTQKKNLSGVGKDRDDAFPFWDHVFSAAANAIKIKTASDDESDDTDTPSETVNLQRTSTGIISNRRPVVGTPALSGDVTPSLSSGASTPRMSVMAAAKQDAARRMLYAMFFRGPVMKSDEEVVPELDPRASQTTSLDLGGVDQIVEALPENLVEVSKVKKIKKGKKTVQDKESVAIEEGRLKAAELGVGKAQKRRKLEREEGRSRSQNVSFEGSSKPDVVSPGEVNTVLDEAAEKQERKKRREEKRARKEERRERKEAKRVERAQVVSRPDEGDTVHHPPPSDQQQVMPLSGDATAVPSDPKPRKKKRKRVGDS